MAPFPLSLKGINRFRGVVSRGPGGKAPRRLGGPRGAFHREGLALMQHDRSFWLSEARERGRCAARWAAESRKPRRPALTGERPYDPQPTVLAREITNEVVGQEVTDELAEAFLTGAAERFEVECARTR